MKTPKHKLPKARVMVCDDDDEYPADVRFQVHQSMSDAKDSNSRSDLKSFYCAVLPRRTRKQVAALVKFANMTEEERVEGVAKTLWNAGNPAHSWHTFGAPWQEAYRIKARAILREIFP